jgi:Rha family phage regulatory protein
MKELIPKNEYGIFVDMKNTVRVDSLFVAEVFGKRHADVLRAIDNTISPKSGHSKEFSRCNFAPSNYIDARGKKQRIYAMTRNGLFEIIMGFTGKKAALFREAYIERFNQMEAQLKTLASARANFPMLVSNIKHCYGNAQSYNFAMECDMINRIVTGDSTRFFRELHGIKKGVSIRPYLTVEQIQMVDELQIVDVGLLLAIPDLETRRVALQEYARRRFDGEGKTERGRARNKSLNRQTIWVCAIKAGKTSEEAAAIAYELEPE